MSQTQESELKTEGGQGSPKYIKLKVFWRDKGRYPDIHYRVKMSAPLGKLKMRYSDAAGVRMTTLRFLYDGRRIYDNETPKMHEMRNDDVIEVYKEQAGDTRNS